MSHIPYGYEVKDGKIFIVEEATDKVRLIFQNYVSGMSLTESAKTAGHPITHSMVKVRMRTVKQLLQRKCYIGNSFYPKIVDENLFRRVQIELQKRQKSTGKTRRKVPVIRTNFVLSDEREPQENFTKQAEYLYSLIGVK